MKLARIDHVHCHEPSFSDPITYVWVADDLSQDEFEDLVVDAVKAYDKAGKDFQEAEQPPYANWGMPQYDKYPNRTVAEVKAEYNAAQALYRDWEERKRKAQANFAHHLVALGGGRIVEFWKEKPALSYALDWGHRHGQKIAHGETDIHDLPGTVEKEDPYL